ncbi:MAG TPA: folylpolyglutamate synthase/dihydrofolate synthase family protein [Bacteroidales bacterium]|nr:folylpolyglutamate synthase/dihydrofolate synthase family protein [Bacteroidales bacterium]
MTDYEKTLAYMFDCLPMFHRVGAAAYKSGLDNTLALSRLCGAPELNIPSVHIAGTNGKGSVSHMIASVLQTQGLKTGLYTSPHLKDFRERIRINGKMIPKSKVVSFVNNYKKDFASIHPSFFEITFELAMEYFSEQKIDIAVVETGMGGRLDSTNIIRSVLTIITNIGLDHTQFLGDTLEKIAFEKAGIIKPGTTVVIGKTQEETEKVFLETASKNKSKIVFADKVFHANDFRFINQPPFGSTCEIQRDDKPFFKNVYCALGGIYQQENIPVVLSAIEQLNAIGYTIEEKNTMRGLKKVIKNTNLQGRWQVLSQQPLVICDTGHNKDGLTQVVTQIKQMQYNKLHIVFGMVSDKDIQAIIKLMPEDATYYFCKPDIPRGLDVLALQKTAASAGRNGKAYCSVAEALSAAREQAAVNDLIFVGGSTFVVAEVL